MSFFPKNPFKIVNNFCLLFQIVQHWEEAKPVILYIQVEKNIL